MQKTIFFDFKTVHFCCFLEVAIQIQLFFGEPIFLLVQLSLKIAFNFRTTAKYP